jgi:hypothetical protein
MAPSQLLSREEFDLLPDDEAATYVEQFMALYGQASPEDASRWLALTHHYVELLEWVVPPDEYERDVRLRFWDVIWEDPKSLLESLEQLGESTELSESKRAEVRARIDEVQAHVEQKRSHADFDEPHD